LQEDIKEWNGSKEEFILKGIGWKWCFYIIRLPELAENKKVAEIHFDKCMNKDNETDKAKEMANKIDMSVVVVDFKPDVGK
jgi:hypothetical protein